MIPEVLQTWSNFFPETPAAREAGTYLSITADKEGQKFGIGISTDTHTYLLTHNDISHLPPREREAILNLFIDTCYPNPGNEENILPPFAFLDFLRDLLPEDADLTAILSQPIPTQPQKEAEEVVK